MSFARSSRTFAQQGFLQACGKEDNLRHHWVDEVTRRLEIAGECFERIKHRRAPRLSCIERNRRVESANLTEYLDRRNMHSPGRADLAGAKEKRRMGTSNVLHMPPIDPLLTVEDVAARLNVTKDWVWDHSSRKLPHLPVIRMSDGTLRYRASRIEEFVNEGERASTLSRKRR